VSAGPASAAAAAPSISTCLPPMILTRPIGLRSVPNGEFIMVRMGSSYRVKAEHPECIEIRSFVGHGPPTLINPCPWSAPHHPLTTVSVPRTSN
jgi:hypothetical protein